MNKTIKKYLLSVLFLIFCFNINLRAQDNTVIFDNANNEYAKGNYQAAIGLYQQIIKSNKVAPELYYNLGNAYFKTNNFPLAILYFEKAKRLNPTDEDIDYNIKVVNNKIIDKIDIVPELFYIRWWRTISSLNTANGWAILSIVSITSLLILVGLYLFSNRIIIRKLCFSLSFLLVVTTALFINFAFMQQGLITNSKEAIIFTPTVSVKSSPDINSVDLFVIHEGTKVEINDNIGEWSEIKIANGSKGWIKKDNYEKI